MSQVVIFGVPASSYVRTVRMVALEKSVPYAFEGIELGGAAHEQLHPWRKVPILRHGDLTVFESSAIARYLEDLGEGPSLLPATAAGRATMEQWISAIHCYLYPALIGDYALRYVRAQLSGQPPDRAAIDAALPAMRQGLARLDRAYAGRAWLAGDALSLADLFVAPIVQTLGMFPEGKAALDGAAELRRAYDALTRRPSFAQVHAGLFGG